MAAELIDGIGIVRARGTDELTYDDALRAVDDECTLIGQSIAADR